MHVCLCSITVNPDPRPQAGQAIPITAYVLPNTAAVGTVQLTYLVNYGSPVTIPMTAAAGENTVCPLCKLYSTASVAALSLLQ